MTRMVQLSFVTASVLAVGLLSPVTHATDTTCVTEIDGAVTYLPRPAGGACIDTTYDLAEVHCSDMWNGDFEAYAWSFGPKSVTGGRLHPFSCADGVLTSFTW